MTVTRSPLRTDSAVRLASSPYALTLTQRVMFSPPVRDGRSMARRSSTPAVPSWVVKLRGSSPSQPVTVTVMGFTVPPGGCREDRPRWWRPGDCGALPGGQVAATRVKGARTPGGPGWPRCFPAGGPGRQRRRAGPPVVRPRLGKDLWPPRGERSESPVAGTEPAAQADRAGMREQPQSRRTTQWPAQARGTRRRVPEPSALSGRAAHGAVAQRPALPEARDQPECRPVAGEMSVMTSSAQVMQVAWPSRIS